MIYNIVAGEELKKIMSSKIRDPIPFNEDMSVGSYAASPFSGSFLCERSAVHKVSVTLYKEKLSSFLDFLDKVKVEDEVHLFFGEDKTCLANSSFLIEYLANKVASISLHIVNEYTGEELSLKKVK